MDGQLVGRGGDDQHLDGPVVLEHIPVVLKANSLLDTGTVVLRSVLAGDAENGDESQQDGDRSHDEPHILEVGHAEAAVFFHQRPREERGEEAEDDGHIRPVKHREKRTLFGVVGQARLTGFCDDALEGVANHIEEVEHHKADELQGLGQVVADEDHQEKGKGHGQVAQEHEGTVFPETCCGAVNDVAQERVRGGVPHAHHGHKHRGYHRGDAQRTVQIVDNEIHCEEIQVGGRVVKRKAPDLPYFRPVVGDLVFHTCVLLSCYVFRGILPDEKLLVHELHDGLDKIVIAIDDGDVSVLSGGVVIEECAAAHDGVMLRIPVAEPRLAGPEDVQSRPDVEGLLVFTHMVRQLQEPRGGDHAGSGVVLHGFGR